LIFIFFEEAKMEYITEARKFQHKKCKNSSWKSIKLQP